MANQALDRGKSRPDRAVRRGRQGFALCGYCNGRVAQITLVPDLTDSDSPFYEVHLPSSMVAGSDGVFRVLRHKWHGQHGIRRFHRETAWLGSLPRSDYIALALVRGPILPATVECPQCAELETLDPSALGIPAVDFVEYAEEVRDTAQRKSPEELEQFYESLFSLIQDHMRKQGADDASIEAASDKLMQDLMLEQREALWDLTRGELLVERGVWSLKPTVDT